MQSQCEPTTNSYYVSKWAQAKDDMQRYVINQFNYLNFGKISRFLLLPYVPRHINKTLTE